jgi:hypothetical protein
VVKVFIYYIQSQAKDGGDCQRSLARCTVLKAKQKKCNEGGIAS